MSHSARKTILAVLALTTWTFAADASGESFSEVIRTSQYVAVRDGTRLAVDVYRPAVNSTPAEKPLPVILAAGIEPRVVVREEKAGLGPHTRFLMDVLKQGYVIASMEARGRGASFGRQTPMRMETTEDYWDLYDVIEWLAKQPWSNGHIGMAGCSNVGVTQFRAAAAMPPHLKAIAPTSAPVDWAMMGTMNGVTTHLFGDWGSGPAPVLEATPVDEDRDGTLLQRAILEQGTWGRALSNRPFRDAPTIIPGIKVLPTDWWNWLPNLAISKTPVFQYAGWRDFFVEQAFALYRSLARQGVPQKLIIGPWYHCDWYKSTLTDAAAETTRWYDYWLKGIDNGLMNGPAIRYYVSGAPAGLEWKTADQWPLSNENRTTYFLGEQGSLHRRTPDRFAGKDTYVVDYTITTANIATRWDRKTLTAFPGESNRPAKDPSLLPIPKEDLAKGSLAYTSAPLIADAELTGFPLVSLWVSSTAADQDFFVYLEEVDTAGRSTLLTEGVIRASSRATREPPFDNEGLPWHPNYKVDQRPLEPGVPTKLEWALFPFSNYVRAGHRLRVTVNSFDKAGWISPELSPAPTVTIYHDRQHPSSITVPFIAMDRSGSSRKSKEPR